MNKRQSISKIWIFHWRLTNREFRLENIFQRSRFLNRTGMQKSTKL